MLGIDVCLLIRLKDYPQSLTNVDILGQGNLNLVSEKSGKSQGILLSIICGNPEYQSPWLTFEISISVQCCDYYQCPRLTFESIIRDQA